MISGRASIDLRDVAPERMKARLGSVQSMPDNAEVVISVGALAVEPEVVWFLREHRDRLRLVIEGEPFNVPRWLGELRSAGLMA